MASMAGQPLYVGVMVMLAKPLGWSAEGSATFTSRTIPRSSTDNTGTSGSGTVSSIDHTAASASVGRLLETRESLLFKLLINGMFSLPGSTRVGSLQVLQLRQNKTHLFGMHPRFSASLHVCAVQLGTVSGLE